MRHTTPSPPEDTTTLRRAAGVLGAHPWIASAELSAGGAPLRVRPVPGALAVRPVPGALIAEHLGQWSEVYDWTYAQGAGRHSADLDLSGWRASGTGLPYPVEHMRDWLRHTVDVVLTARPRWVLELGCGTGMLLHRLMPRLEGYVGTDVAAESVRSVAASAPRGALIVRAAAHEVLSTSVAEALRTTGFPGGRPDCVLINSVTQCFPNVAYLRAVIQDALRLVAPGGTVIVGDVRHSGLLREHHRRLATTDTTGTAIEERVRRDEELLFDPVLLAGIAAELGPEIGDAGITVHAKTMRAGTELTRYRFDAVLHVPATDTPGAVGTAPETTAWTTLDAARDRLAAAPGLITGIPNASLSPGHGSTAAALRDALAGLDVLVTLDPHDPRLLEAGTRGSATRRARDLAGPGTAHEPLPAFVRRRLTELARHELRRAGLPLVPMDIDFDTDTGTEASHVD
ncbi:class I SAM-dependent methyltransferase [Saccharomonospora sp. NPDC006951]